MDRYCILILASVDNIISMMKGIDLKSYGYYN